MLRDWITNFNEEALLADGFEDAILGVAERCSQAPVVVYDASRCIEILIERGMNHEEALDYFHHNTLGAWVGPNTPMFLWRYPQGDQA